MKCISFDLPAVEPIARKTIAREGLSDRIQTAAGDFFRDSLPKADVITTGMILHDWNLEKKKHLIRAAYNALPQNPRSSPSRISSTTSGAKTPLAC
jgi:O-methyltransferase domain